MKINEDEYGFELIQYMKQQEHENKAVYITGIMEALNLDKYDVIEMIDECAAREYIELQIVDNNKYLCRVNALEEAIEKVCDKKTIAKIRWELQQE